MGYDRCLTVFHFDFWTKWNSIWFKIERKTVTTIISHSIWMEMETQFSQCMENETIQRSRVQSSQRLSSLGISRGELSSPIIPLNITAICTENFKGEPQYESKTPDLFFSSLWYAVRISLAVLYPNIFYFILWVSWKNPPKKFLWIPLSANLFRLKSSILTRAKRATNRNNV